MLLFLIYDGLGSTKFMAFFSPKKLILSGFIVILLVAIPLTLYLVQKQQEIRGRAVAATTLSLIPSTTTTSVGQTINFDISLDPGGKNQVSFVKLVISYDSTKLATGGSGFVPNIKVLSSTLQDPVYGPDTITTTLSVGADPTKVIQTKATIASVTFQALAPTDPNMPTKITFGNQTQILSIAPSDQFNENVLSTTNPASVTITGGAVLPTLTPAMTITPTPISIGGPVNQLPNCTALNLDRDSTGTAPYSITFTASGNDPDGTVSKVTFNFGDGIPQDVTQTGGIGTNSVNAQSSHTYANPGTYTATATLTDNQGALSNSLTCTQTITINQAIGGGNGGGGGGLTPTSTPTLPPTVTVSPRPTLAPTGPGDQIIGIGIAGIVFSIIGGALLLIL